MERIGGNGVCIFAYNNADLDYSALALIAAGYVKRNMKNNSVTLITDQVTVEHLEKYHDERLIEKFIDNIVIQEPPRVKNLRVHHDSPYTTFTTQFTNHNKSNIIDYSPYDRTLLIDVDYFIMNNDLDLCFETDEPLMMWNHATDLVNRLPHPAEQRLTHNGINMWWSTVVYFDRSDFARMFFDTWAHVRDNYEYYKFRYNFPGHLFRTDYASSIAIHIMNGFTESDMIKTLPTEHMRYSDQKDNIISIDDANTIKFLSNDPNEHWKDILVNWKNHNLHLMNKKAILRNYNRFMEVLDD